MRICVLGATGLVGRESLGLIDRAWPGAETVLYASRDQVLDHKGKKLQVASAQSLEQDNAPRGDLALVALDDEHSRRYVPRLLALGYRVIDKSNTYRMDRQVPLVVAGVNHAEVGSDTRLVANPNCTTIPLALVLAPLLSRFGIASVAVSTYQAISGAGQAALDDFREHSAAGYARADRFGLELDPLGYPGNTVPHNAKTDESGYSAEERKLMFESRRILGRAELPLSAQCCRVPVAVGHYENAWVTLEHKAALSEIETVLANTASHPFLRLIPGSAGEGLSALACVHDRDRALVGRLRTDPRDPSGKSVCLTVVGDNLRLGAATNAVRIASCWFPAEDPQLAAPGSVSASAR
jgi:aspartate-semialdehyde dehydrogenase